MSTHPPKPPDDDRSPKDPSPTPPPSRSFAIPDGTTIWADEELPASDAFPGFAILREISRGGQGVVYQALQTSTKRKVAIKVLRAGAFASETTLKRFQREIELVAQLDHPNIVSVFHADATREGQKFFAMDYVRGRALNEYLQETSPGVRPMLELFAKICEAIEYAHHRGIIHRDLKPSNIMIDSNGEPKMLDFGLAKLQSSPAQTLVSLSHQFLGTLPYMSPEQVRGNPELIDVRTDVYALGVLLFHCLTGGYPYDVDCEIPDAINNIQYAPPGRASERRTGLDDEIDTIIGKCLAKDRERRYASAGAIAVDVRRYLAGQPILAKRDSLVYVLRTRTRTAVRRHPVAALATSGVVGLLVAVFLLGPLIERWTPLQAKYERAAAAVAAAFAVQTDFPQVTVIAMTDDTPLPERARRERLDAYSPRDRTSLRALHGRLMRNMAAGEIRPLALCWDISFGQPSAHDDEFVRGVQALDAVGVPVVAAVSSWWADGDGRPKMSPAIADVVRYGCSLIRSTEEPWQVPLAMQCGERDPLPSLATATVAAAQRPQSIPSYAIAFERLQLSIRYHTKTATPAGIRRAAGDPDVLSFTITGTMRDAGTEARTDGLCRHDRLAMHTLDLPNDAILASATVDYDRVFDAGSQDRRDWFENRIVVVGDLRGDSDMHSYRGRAVRGCYGHAVAIQHLLNKLNRPAPLRFYARRWGYSDRAAFAVIGVLIGYFAPRRRWPMAVGLFVLLCLLSGGLAAGMRYFWNPLASFGAMLIAMELAALVHRRAGTKEA